MQDLIESSEANTVGILGTPVCKIPFGAVIKILSAAFYGYACSVGLY